MELDLRAEGPDALGRKARRLPSWPFGFFFVPFVEAFFQFNLKVQVKPTKMIGWTDPMESPRVWNRFALLCV